VNPILITSEPRGDHQPDEAGSEWNMAATDRSSVALATPDLREELPARVQEVCATAVDPLEIAATLEVCGISNRVARDRFRQPDLFHMAHQLFRSTPFELAPLKKNALAERGGSPADLGRACSSRSTA